MLLPREYGFTERKQFAETANQAIEAILLSEIPGATQVRRASLLDDKKGTDFWVDAGTRTLSVDVKIRNDDYSLWGEDDLALETFSVVEHGKIGWTRDDTKITDCIQWYWRDTGRWCLLPFFTLRTVFDANWEQWRSQFKTRQQFTKGTVSDWHSECVFVPRLVVLDEIGRRFGAGVVPLDRHKWLCKQIDNDCYYGSQYGE